MSFIFLEADPYLVQVGFFYCPFLLRFPVCDVAECPKRKSFVDVSQNPFEVILLSVLNVTLIAF